MKDWCYPLAGIHYIEWETENLNDQCFVTDSSMERVKMALGHSVGFIAPVCDGCMILLAF